MERRTEDRRWRMGTRRADRWTRLCHRLPQSGVFRRLGVAAYYALIVLHCLGVAAAVFMFQMLVYVTLFDSDTSLDTHRERFTAVEIGTGVLIAGGLALFGVRFYRALHRRIVDLESLAGLLASVTALILFTLFTYANMG